MLAAHSGLQNVAIRNEIPLLRTSDLQVAFACNNLYHLAIAKSVAQSLPSKSDLYLFGRSEILQGAEDARLPIWRNREEWFHDGSLRNLLAMSTCEISRRIGRLSSQQYQFIFYFVDKEPTNQLFLRTHSESRKVLIQEGIGLYNGVPMSFRERAMKSLVWSWKFRVLLRCRGSEQGANLYHDDVIARWPQAIPSCKVGRAKVHGYEQAMPSAEYVQTTDTNRTSGGVRQQPLVLFVGSPVVNLGWISEEREAEIVRYFVDAADKSGSSFCVKPHPREAVTKYERIDPRIHVVRDKEPVESFCMQHRPQVVLSFMSSALLNLCYQPRLVYLYDLIDRDFPNKDVLESLRHGGCTFETPASLEEAGDAIGTTSRHAKRPPSVVRDHRPFIKDIIARIVENA